MTTDINTASPWYTYPWVWFLITVPASAVLFGVVMIVSANYAPDDLVEDNYYKEGMGINLRLREDAAASAQGAKASLQAITPEGLVMEIEGGGPQLVLSAYHVTDRSKDVTVELTATGSVYTARSPELAAALSGPGVWYLEVRDEERGWRVRERVVSPLNHLEMHGDE